MTSRRKLQMSVLQIKNKRAGGTSDPSHVQNQTVCFHSRPPAGGNKNHCVITVLPPWATAEELLLQTVFRVHGEAADARGPPASLSPRCASEVISSFFSILVFLVIMYPISRSLLPVCRMMQSNSFNPNWGCEEKEIKPKKETLQSKPV